MNEVAKEREAAILKTAAERALELFPQDPRPAWRRFFGRGDPFERVQVRIFEDRIDATCFDAVFDDRQVAFVCRDCAEPAPNGKRRPLLAPDLDGRARRGVFVFPTADVSRGAVGLVERINRALLLHRLRCEAGSRVAAVGIVSVPPQSAASAEGVS